MPPMPPRRKSRATVAKRRPATSRRKAVRRSGHRSAAHSANPEAGDRLQKVLAAAGFGSRRACEELIVEGRVEVDRKAVTELGTRVDSAKQEIRVDGEPLKLPKLVYYAAHKPVGVVSTSADPAGRPQATDLVPDKVRVFTVGRLDRESEGLLLLTNDGDLANRLTHPRHGVEKIYQVQVAGYPSYEELKPLKVGVRLAEGSAKVKRLKLLKRQKQSTWLEIVLDEGRNREIRRVLARLGYKVQHLKRVAIGPLRLGELAAGEYRPLSRQEIRDLKAFLANAGSSASASGPPRNRRAPKHGPARQTSCDADTAVDCRKERAPRAAGRQRTAKKATAKKRPTRQPAAATRKPRPGARR